MTGFGVQHPGSGVQLPPDSAFKIPRITQTVVLTRRRADKDTSDSFPSCLLVTMARAARVVCVEPETGHTIWRLRR